MDNESLNILKFCNIYNICSLKIFIHPFINLTFYIKIGSDLMAGQQPDA